MSFLHSSRLHLLERLALHVEREVAVQAAGFASEPGVLQKVGKRFMRVNGQYFVPGTLQEIVLFGLPRMSVGAAAIVRTLYAGTFEARLIRTGRDFAELLVSRPEEEEELQLLVPFAQIISLEPAAGAPD